jgi:ADP-heptose:LPS heptosyltransferase
MTGPRICLFKLNYLGDAVTFLPTVAGVRRLFPDADLSVVCSVATKDLYEATFPGIRTIGVDRRRINGWRGLGTLPQLIRALGLGKTDCALLSHDEPTLAYLAATCSLAPQRIGFQLTRPLVRRTLTAAMPALPGRNIVDLNFDLVRRLAANPLLDPLRTPIGFSSADATQVEATLSAVGIEAGEPFVLFHPFGKKSYQLWGTENYAAAAKVLEGRGVKTVFVNAGPAAEPPYVRWVGGLTITQLAALCGRARLFIGSNSGPTHVAAAMGTPAVVVQGATSVEWNIPWDDVPHRHLSARTLSCVPCERLGKDIGDCGNLDHPMACMQAIPVAAVVEAALEMLA